MGAWLLRNNEFRNLLFILLALSLLFAVVTMKLISDYASKSDSFLTYRDVVIIDSLLENGVNESDVFSAFDLPERLDHSKVGNSLRVAERYGYTLTPSNYNKQKLPPNIFNYIVPVVLLWIICVLAVTLFFGRRFYSTLRRYSYAADQITSDNYDIRLDGEGEGEIALLGFQLNQMAHRLKLSVARIKQERKLLQDMSAHISHQLKTPLSSLQTFLELLEGDTDKKTEKEFIAECLTQVERMEWLIHTLLKLSRLRTDRIQMNFEPNDLVQRLKEVLATVRPQYQQKGLHVEVVLPDEPVVIAHDAHWVAEAILNVLVNAIKYTKPEGQIQVSLKEGSTFTRIEVSDSGVGIANEDLALVFDEFYQGKRSRGMDNTGSGLGLTLTKTIVDKHGGIIDIHNSHLGGTKVIISLPYTKSG